MCERLQATKRRIANEKIGDDAIADTFFLGSSKGPGTFFRKWIRLYDKETRSGRGCRFGFLGGNECTNTGGLYGGKWTLDWRKRRHANTRSLQDRGLQSIADFFEADTHGAPDDNVNVPSMRFVFLKHSCATQ